MTRRWLDADKGGSRSLLFEPNPLPHTSFRCCDEDLDALTHWPLGAGVLSDALVRDVFGDVIRQVLHEVTRVVACLTSKLPAGNSGSVVPIEEVRVDGGEHLAAWHPWPRLPQAKGDIRKVPSFVVVRQRQLQMRPREGPRQGCQGTMRRKAARPKAGLRDRNRPSQKNSKTRN